MLGPRVAMGQSAKASEALILFLAGSELSTRLSVSFVYAREGVSVRAGAYACVFLRNI